MAIFLTASITAVVVSFLCSLLEATLLSLDDIHLETRRKEGHRYAAIWQGMKRRIDRPIAAILILNTVAHTGGATVAGSAFDEIYGDEWIWVFSVIFTAIVLIGTEIIPKILGVSYSDRLAPVLAPVLALMTTLLTPVIAVTEWLARPFKAKGGKRRMSLADLRTMAELAEDQRVIGVEEEAIIINATKLRQVTVASVMMPADRIVMFDVRQPNISNFETAASSLHTRYPVTRDGTVDGIAGYVNFKELVAMMPSRREAEIERFTRPLIRVAASASLNDALRSLLGRREHMALVEDERHRIVGLLTIEDLMEELLGELSDEFDSLSDEILEVAPRRWKIGGGAAMSEVARISAARSVDDDAASNLSDWITRRLGREPRVGDTVVEADAMLTVIQTRRRRANRVLVELLPASPGTS
ncbi:MAG: HlyC/CorC family transporter [Verrucomicrobiae bacterium]|nr:HlyC/CorC family transporter [Verrucomicrobiae bacterium]